MKRLALLLLLLLILCGCSAQQPSVPTPSEYGPYVFDPANRTLTPELLIAPRRVTPTPWPTRTPFALNTVPPTQDIYVPRNVYSPTPQTCRIKGNVSTRNKEQKIYHCPGWPDYAETTVITSEGDRWFCSEAEAIAAGFRRPKNVSLPCRP